MNEHISAVLKPEDVINLTPDYKGLFKGQEKFNPKKELENFVKSPWTIVGGIGGIVFAGGIILSGEASIAVLHLKVQQTLIERWWVLSLVSPYGGGSLGYFAEKIWGETKKMRGKSKLLGS